MIERPCYLTIDSTSCEHFKRAFILSFSIPPTLLHSSTLPLIENKSSNPNLNFNLLYSHFSFLIVLFYSLTMASRVALLVFLCVLPAMVSAIRPAKNPFCLKGRVVCDPCRAGYETSAITHIAGNFLPVKSQICFLK